MSTKPRVAYFYDAEIGNYYFGPGHPNKPHRIRMAHNLLLNYHIYEKMDVYRPPAATEQELTKFHADDYIKFLQMITPQNMASHAKQIQRFNIGDDCPIFDGIFDFCKTSAGGSIAGAVKLNFDKADVAINWAGGLHHAKKCEASGFCFVNDIVLAILELLKVHYRVLYVDIDIHHGDGVEEAFYTTDRVMTVSFHKYGDYFPGTGDVLDVGAKAGKYYAINYPLRDGIDDECYESIFRPLITRIMEQYQPGAVVVCCGADSLAGDRLGTFNLSIRGHGRCIEHIRSFGLPTLLVGGGGYTIRNVARCWAYETALCLGEPLRNELPYNDYWEYYAPDYTLHIRESNMVNLNTPESLSATTRRILEHLRYLPAAPGVTIGGGAETAPRDPMVDIDVDDDDDNPDERESHRARDARIRPSNDYGPIPGDIPHHNIHLTTNKVPQSSSGTPGENNAAGSEAVSSDANYLEKTLCSVQSEVCALRAGDLDDGAQTVTIQENHMGSESATIGTVDGGSHSEQLEDGRSADCAVKSPDNTSIAATVLSNSSDRASGDVLDVLVPGVIAAQSPTKVSATLLDQNHAIPVSVNATEGTKEICMDGVEALPAASSDSMDIDQDPAPTTKACAVMVEIDSISTDAEAAKERLPEVMELDDASADHTATVSTATIPAATSAALADSEPVSSTPSAL